MYRLLLLITAFLAASQFCAQTATIRYDQERQTIEGFGGASAWFVDELMRHPDRDALLNLLFKVDGGAGLSILRHRISPKAGDRIDFGMELSSGDLDLGTKQLSGLRFSGLAIPQGATVTDARIQFTSTDAYSAPSSLRLWGQDVNNAGAFTGASANLSGRTRTSATVGWTVGSWSAGGNGNAERTPNLKAIVQEIVNRSGWNSGNALVFLIGDYSGKRSAHSFDGSGAAPRLTVTLGNGQTITKSIGSSNDDAEESGPGAWLLTAQMTQEAFARDCEKVWASSWSPPYEWKTSNAERSGFLKPEHYQDFADHLEAYRLAHDANAGGAELHGISPQNEPGKKPWESCEWDPNDFRDFIKFNAGPTINTKLLAPEETRWALLPGRYDPIHNDPVARGYTDIISAHVYDQQMDIDYTDYGKPIWQTEWSYDTSPEDAGIANGARWAHNLHRMLVNAKVNAWHHWWLVNFKNDGRQQGLINAVADVPGYSVTKRFWTIGNFSKFVRPGWKRIEATANPTADVYVSAFKDPTSGKFAIVAINRSTGTKTLSLDFDGFTAGQLTPHRTSGSEDLSTLGQISAGGGASVSLPAQSVTTFTGSTDGGGSTQSPYAGSPFTVEDGAVLRATHYDNGGAGVAYFDTSPGNAGGCGRADDVDKGGSNSCILGWNVAGEWLEYTVAVPTGGNFDITAQLAGAFDDRSVRLKLGATTLGTLNLDNASTGWNDYRPTTLSGVNLPAGTHVLRLEIVTDAINVRNFTFSRNAPPSGQIPYFGSPQIITDGSVLKAWTYDEGGPGVAFSDTDDGNHDGCGRSDDVDLGGSGDNCNVGWIIDGEWTEYTVDVTAGTYDIEVEMASTLDGRTLQLTANGQVLGSVDCDNGSTGWGDYRSVVLPAVNLAGGVQVIRLEALDSYFNVRNLTFRRQGGALNGLTTGRPLQVRDWRIFPIPASEVLTVQPPERGPAYGLEIFDVTGRLLRSFPVATGPRRIGVNDLNPGVYTLRLLTREQDAEGSTILRRFVVR